MAIDDEEKRAAVLGVGRPWMRDKFPIATPDEEWRISSGNAYGGNALSAAGTILRFRRTKYWHRVYQGFYPWWIVLWLTQ